MDFWIRAGLSEAIELLKDKRGRVKFYGVLAKLHSKLELLEVGDPEYHRMIEAQRKKGTVA